MIRTLSISACLLAVLLLAGFATVEGPLEKLRRLLTVYTEAYPDEKVYVQCDKPFYKPGEDIWFNAFVVNGTTLNPGSPSDVVYVNLVDPKGNVVIKRELLINEGMARGDFKLDSSAAGGLYHLEAYTLWTKNFGEEASFRKEVMVQHIITPRLLLKLDFIRESYGPGDHVDATLSVRDLADRPAADAVVAYTIRITGGRTINLETRTDGAGKAILGFSLPGDLKSADVLLNAVVSVYGVQESISRSVPVVLNAISLQFFPEGGSWQAGVPCRIAFKALNEYGKGADVSGSIVDDKGTVVTSFESFHMGMGAFTIMAAPGRSYFARVEIPRGITTQAPLPVPGRESFVMNLSGAVDHDVTWKIWSAERTTALLTGQMRGELFYSETLRLNAGENSLHINTDKFPMGIAVFTLFNSGGKEQAERLVFLNNHKQLRVKLTMDKKQYSPGERVNVTVETTDAAGKAVPAQLSLAVVDDQVLSFADDKQDNILSSLLLSSDVRGEIQEPSFYFDEKETKAAEALDYLLMTQGWRRFTWADVQRGDRLITYVPERIRNLAGTVVNNDGVGISSEVTLLEMGNRHRIERVRTTQEGHFVFRNIDPAVPILLVTRNPGILVLQRQNVIGSSLHGRNGAVPVSLGIVRPEEAGSNVLFSGDAASQFVTMDEDVAELSEVIVTAAGWSVGRREITGSVVRVAPVDITLPVFSPLLALQGRVAGIAIQSNSGAPGAATRISIGGISSLGRGQGEPLYIIDGVPISEGLNSNFSPDSFIGSESIESISVMRTPEATTLFGSRAANGVVMISTRKRLPSNRPAMRKRKYRYTGTAVSARKFSPVREFYVAPPAASKVRRDNFRSTVYWNPLVKTDKSGTATISFHGNDAVSAFRIIAEGISNVSLVGRGEHVFSTMLPVSLDAKLPEYMGYEDEVRIAVRVSNADTLSKTGELRLDLPAGLTVKEGKSVSVAVSARSTQTIHYTLRSEGVEGDFPIVLRLSVDGYSDEVKHILHVQPAGFPARFSFSGQMPDQSMSVDLSHAERGSIRAQVEAYPELLNSLLAGVEAMFREPHGCFEQVSSTTFPNILALQFLQNTKKVNPVVEQQAMQYIKRGYALLKGYEIAGGGFEWFGHPAAHEGLTAYGLLEFCAMQDVFKDVDPVLVNRTRSWLLGRRNGKGGFRQSRGKYAFSAAAESVVNAYIVYALAETGTRDIIPEYEASLKEAVASNDMYRMALVANAAHNLGRKDDYELLMKLFRRNAAGSGVARLKADHSLVSSYGNSLQVETASLWTLAVMKSPDCDRSLVKTCIDFLLRNRQYGQFGSTQATVLALMTLTHYAQLVKTGMSDGILEVSINDEIVQSRSYSKDAVEKVTLDGFDNRLTCGTKPVLRVAFKNTPAALPYSFNLLWRTKLPPSAKDCRVQLWTTLSESQVSVNGTVRLGITLHNVTHNGLPMTMAVVGIPGGLSAQPWQLKELQEKGVFDFYEVQDGKVVLYFREMAPDGVNVVNLDLKAEVAGSYTGAASCAYLYYYDELKHWVAGNHVMITPGI